MALYIGETQINSLEIANTQWQTPLGPVQNIRYSIVDSQLNVKWQDPDDSYYNGALVAKFAGTKLLVKVGSYPEDENDGTMLVNSTTRNFYNDQTFIAQLPVYAEEVTYYFRFFSYDDQGHFNGETQSISQNRFSSQTYSWDQVLENLHNWPTDSSLLPAPGSVIGLKYILNDFYTPAGGANVICNTRQKVYDARTLLQSVSIPWVVLGYNANVPQYLQYRRKLLDGTYDCLFVSSLNDAYAVTSVQELGQATPTQMKLTVGDGYFREIAIGCKTYVESYDAIKNTHSYQYTNKDVQFASVDKFTFLNEGIGKGFEYRVPLSITVDGNTYTFCGYSMTMMPVNCLGGHNGSSFQNAIQFDISENASAIAYESYPAAATADRYFYNNNGDYVEIDWKNIPLFGQYIGTYGSGNYDVYQLVDGKMELRTSRFGEGLTYFRYNGTTEVNLVVGTDYNVGDTIPTSPETYVRNHNDRKNYGSNTYADSNLRQYLNNVNGSSDAGYVKKNKFDVISTNGLMQENGILLKLIQEQDFIKHIKPAANYVQLANNQRYYRPYKIINNIYCECEADLFWLLGNYEVNGTGADGSATFNQVFTNNESRKKYALTSSGTPATSSSNWWLRSPYTGSMNPEYYINTSGSLGTNISAYNSSGLSPACLLT